MAALVCTVSGALTDATGAAKARAIVRARILDGGAGSVLSGVAVGIAPITVLTDEAGAWAIALPQGARVRLELPAAGVDHVGTIPAASSVAFEVLFPAMTEFQVGFGAPVRRACLWPGATR